MSTRAKKNRAELIAIRCRCRRQHFDSETELHYNYFRDYDPGTGTVPAYRRSMVFGRRYRANARAYHHFYKHRTGTLGRSITMLELCARIEEERRNETD